ncbi:putative NADH dehydrogenase [ubiquinone] 1 alpha subcomplex subunit 5, mitochondrial [Capsicum annuum]|uniref:NADH dehydrogenase [ubiquinone] 1 alpha subcomplex subunit 5, mitochondrial n=1 Tax=Capsicum annuum TaxID=4072 RepID=A0A2G2Z3N1_CAPAN|nr:putative NADH dehydrogenase [ubiquinone] 1 alpha subcomplex subunit 5, mitochondrial [Capsicum annuum]PHT76511.1 putative NADH dehydrogenase [ubiquinone] 1 alpha subcomplex subunit 5, mitochondrial [Capsicum annuum]
MHSSSFSAPGCPLIYINLPKMDDANFEIFYHVIIFVKWKPWRNPDYYECEVIENDAPVPKHVPLHRPGPLPEEFYYKTMETVISAKLETSKKDAPAIASQSK